MPVQERSTREIQDECAEVAVQLEGLAHRLHWAREALRLPPDAADLWDEVVPWTPELEVSSMIGLVVEDHLDTAAKQLRRIARITAEELRNRHRTAARERLDHRQRA